MEAKEKAEELVLKFLRIDNNTPEWFNTHIAKQCALIAVIEIISGYEFEQCALIAVIEIISGYEFDSLEIEHKRIMDSINFWDEVKQEINNI